MFNPMITMKTPAASAMKPFPHWKSSPLNQRANDTPATYRNTRPNDRCSL
jgi:hypothetical protein